MLRGTFFVEGNRGVFLRAAQTALVEGGGTGFFRRGERGHPDKRPTFDLLDCPMFIFSSEKIPPRPVGASHETEKKDFVFRCQVFLSGRAKPVSPD